MSGALGIGVRVYIGWAPRNQVANAEAMRALCSTGTIAAGPLEPGEGQFWLYGQIVTNNRRMWGVDPDHCPRTYCCETLLTPIDDWDEKAEPREAAKPVEA